jgi:hypothetical protein
MTKCTWKNAFFNFHENAKSMQNFSFPRKFSQQTYKTFVKPKNFAKVVAKTKNLKEFDSDLACMVYVVSLFFLYNITFFEDKINKVVM